MLHKTLMASVLTLLALLLSPTISTGNELRTLVGVGWVDEMLTVGGSENELTSATGPLTDATTDGLIDGGEVVSGSASASAEYGTLGVAAEIDVTNSDNISNLAGGAAVFTDTFTFTGGADGSSGTANLVFNITGSSVVTGAGQVTAGVFVLQDTAFTFEALLAAIDTATITVDGNDFGVSTPVPIVFGTPTEITIALLVSSSTLLLDASGGPVSGTAEGAYDKTLHLVGINSPETDLLGIEASSGTEYLNGATSAVPEPSSFALAVVAFLSLGFVGSRRRRR
jgi:hypothetical protein